VLGFLDKDTLAKTSSRHKKVPRTWHDPASHVRAIHSLGDHGRLPGPTASDREQGVIENVAPIQLGIRYSSGRLAHAGLEDVRRMIAPFDPQSLAYPWRAPIRDWTH